MKFVFLLVVLCAVSVTVSNAYSSFSDDPFHEGADLVNQITNKVEDAWDDINDTNPFDRFVRRLGRAGRALGLDPNLFIVIVFAVALIFFVLLLKCCCCSSSKQRPTVIYATPPYSPMK